MQLLSVADRARRRRTWPPQVGLFVVRLHRHTPRLPARILRTEDGQWCAEINGTLCIPHTDPDHAQAVKAIWRHGLTCDPDTYAWLREQHRDYSGPIP